jgi:hypothetical protein
VGYVGAGMVFIAIALANIALRAGFIVVGDRFVVRL